MRKNNLIKAGFLGIVCISLAFLIMTSCEKNTEEIGTDQQLFLKIDKSLEFSSFTQEDWAVFSMALGRLTINVDDNGLFQIEQECGIEINMSENLFNLLKELVDNSNQQKVKLVEKRLSIVRTKTLDENPQDTRTDCVAQSIFAAIQDLGGSTSFSEINSWIISNYGNDGVPLSEYYNALSHFLQGEQYTVPANYSYNASQIIMVAIDFGGGDGHAARLMSASNGNVAVYDPIMGLRIFSSSQIVRAYHATGYK